MTTTSTRTEYPTREERKKTAKERRRFTFDDENMQFGGAVGEPPRIAIVRRIRNHVGAVAVSLHEDSISPEGHDVMRAKWHDNAGAFHEATVHAAACCRFCRFSVDQRTAP